MADEQMNPRAADVADSIVRRLKARIGQAAFEAMSPEHVQLIQECADDAAVLQIAAMTTPPEDRPAWATLNRRMADVKSQLLNIDAAMANAVSSAFWQIVRDVAHSAIALVIAAA